jgi:hypothetical protein
MEEMMADSLPIPRNQVETEALALVDTESAMHLRPETKALLCDILGNDPEVISAINFIEACDLQQPTERDRIILRNRRILIKDKLEEATEKVQSQMDYLYKDVTWAYYNAGLRGFKCDTIQEFIDLCAPDKADSLVHTNFVEERYNKDGTLGFEDDRTKSYTRLRDCPELRDQAKLIAYQLQILTDIQATFLEDMTVLEQMASGRA